MDTITSGLRCFCSFSLYVLHTLHPRQYLYPLIPPTSLTIPPTFLTIPPLSQYHPSFHTTPLTILPLSQYHPLLPSLNTTPLPSLNTTPLPPYNTPSLSIPYLSLNTLSLRREPRVLCLGTRQLRRSGHPRGRGRSVGYIQQTNHQCGER